MGAVQVVWQGCSRGVHPKAKEEEFNQWRIETVAEMERDVAMKCIQ
jgi:hypothetical protein